MPGAPRHFHFLGICGTAMGAVTAALRERGFTVTGSDENIAAAAEIIVVGNAMTRGNPEVEAVLNRKVRGMAPASAHEV